MIATTLKPAAESPSSSSFAATLLDGASLYGINMLDQGFYSFAFVGVASEGLLPAYGSGAPFWGEMEMFSDGVVGVNYDDQWDLTSASTPTTYSVISGALPDGLTLESVSGNTGRIYGTPTVADTFNFTLRATNAFGTADQAFTIVIVAPAAGGGGAYAFIS